MHGIPTPGPTLPHTGPLQRLQYQPLRSDTAAAQRDATAAPPETGALTGCTEPTQRRWRYPPDRPLNWSTILVGDQAQRVIDETQECADDYDENFCLADASVVETMWKVSIQHNYLPTFEQELQCCMVRDATPTGWQQRLIDNLYLQRGIAVQMRYPHNARRGQYEVQHLTYVRFLACEVGVRRALTGVTGLPKVLESVVADYATFGLPFGADGRLILNRHTRDTFVELVQLAMRDPSNTMLQDLVGLVMQMTRFAGKAVGDHLLIEPASYLDRRGKAFIAVDTRSPEAPDQIVLVERAAFASESTVLHLS